MLAPRAMVAQSMATSGARPTTTAIMHRTFMIRPHRRRRPSVRSAASRTLLRRISIASGVAQAGTSISTGAAVMAGGRVM